MIHLNCKGFGQLDGQAFLILSSMSLSWAVASVGSILSCVPCCSCPFGSGRLSHPDQKHVFGGHTPWQYLALAAVEQYSALSSTSKKLWHTLMSSALELRC